MPPKKGPQKPSGKTVDKAKKKLVEDKTFGLKNKNKSKKAQQFVAAVQANVKYAGKSRAQLKQEETKKAEKEAKKQAQKSLEAEMASLFKAVVTKKQEVAKDVDPKSVLCEHFKAGACKFGKKCKFSHDMEVARKTAKINLYHDPRQMAEDTIDKWDQAKLEEVVATQEKKRPNETKIVCKYFLDAVENFKYGWRWQCPNGETCIYKHALPEGFVFKKPGEKKEEEADTGPTIEEQIEVERKQLDLSKCTPVTLERFQKWKEERKKKKASEVEEKRKAAAAKSGSKGLHVLSGRDLFIYDPSLFVDDEGAASNDEYETRNDEEESKEAEKNYNSDSEEEKEAGEKEEKEVDGSEAKEEKKKESKVVSKEKTTKKEEKTTGNAVEEKSDKKKKKKKKKTATTEKTEKTEKDKTKDTTKDKSKEKTPAPATTTATKGDAEVVNQELFLADEDLPDEDDL